MVSIVTHRSGPQAEGNQTMHRPREVVAAVVLGGHPDVEQHERPGGETVALEEQRIHGGPETHAEELPSRQVLRNQAEGLPILVVERVEGAVEPGDAVMQQVPQVVLEVEDHCAAQDSQQEGGERGRLAGERHGRPPEPLGYGGWEDVEQMVVRGERQSGADVGPSDGAVLVDLVASDGGPGGRQQVQHGVEEHQHQVHGHREDDGKQRRAQGAFVVLLKVIPHGLQDGALRQSPGCVADVQHATQTAGIHVKLRVVDATARLLLLLRRDAQTKPLQLDGGFKEPSGAPGLAVRYCSCSTCSSSSGCSVRQGADRDHRVTMVQHLSYHTSSQQQRRVFPPQVISKTASPTLENSLFTNTKFTSRLSTRYSAAVMPSKLEGAMDALITVFHNYSGSEGDKYKLSKGELKELLNSELTDFLTSQKDPMLVEKIMNDLDSNKDNEVDFNEFVVLVAALTVACNDFFQEQQKKKSKDEKKDK
ncbi:protein S100-Z isoform X2 [Labeo rohita]|uniref:protein S100-Z isoform X2 n=1 Tax=Labeo rohita TaxID=84645 RepID=UPI0021E32318|nr:protein S100-Z isoform X2 [Labeo rohita]